MQNQPSHSARPLPASSLDSRGALLAACAALFGGVVLNYAGLAWLSIVYLLLTDGLLVLLWVLAAACLGDLLVRPARHTDSRPLAFATAAGVGLGAFSLAALGLGLAGALNQMIAIALPAGSVLAWVAIVGRRSIHVGRDLAGPLGAWLRRPAGWHWLLLAAMPALAVMVVAASVPPGFMWKPDDPHPYDVVSYHLQVPREWYELGRVVPLRHNMFSYFPFNVEMQYLLGMHLRGGPWAGMYFAQFMSIAYALLTAIAVYGIARTFATRAGATLATVAVLTVPWVIMLGSVAYVEPALLLYVALACGWAMVVVRSLADAPARATLVAAAIAGACAGLACGVKLTAGPMLLAPVPVAIVIAAALASRRTTGRAIVAATVVGVVGLLVFSPWPLRNIAWAGNPVWPNAAGLFGPGHFSPGQLERYAIAHAAVPGGAGPIGATWSQALVHWQYGYALVPLALLGLALGGRRQAGIVVVVAIVLLLQWVFWIGFTHRVGRFLVTIVPLAAMLIACVDRSRLARAAAAIVIVLASLVGWLWDASGAGGTHGRLAPYAAIGRQGVFGLTDLGAIQPLEVQQMSDAGATMHLVGNAQAFLHTAPSAQVKYRSIFDVRSDAADPVVAWTGLPLAELPAGDWAYVDPAEVQRLAATYRHVPDLPAGFPGPRNVPFLINRQGQIIVPQR